MNDPQLKEFGEKLRKNLPPLRQPELTRDLWPDFLQIVSAPRADIPWFDWALVALAAAALIFFPGVIPALLYHL